MGVDSTQRLVANALFQPIYANSMVNSIQTAVTNSTKTEEVLPPEVAVSVARNAIAKPASGNVRVQSLMVTPREQATRSSFTFSGAAPKRCLLVTVKMNTSNRVKVNINSSFCPHHICTCKLTSEPTYIIPPINSLLAEHSVVATHCIYASKSRAYRPNQRLLVGDRRTTTLDG
jgi:hypothetical protein